MNTSDTTFISLSVAALIALAFALGWLICRTLQKRELQRLHRALRNFLRGGTENVPLKLSSPELRKLWQIATFTWEREPESSVPAALEIGKKLSSAVGEIAGTATAVGELIKEKSAPEAIAVAVIHSAGDQSPAELQYCYGIPETRIKETLLSFFDSLVDGPYRSSDSRAPKWGKTIPVPGSMHDFSVFGIGSVLSVPISSGNKVRGMIWLGFGLRGSTLSDEKMRHIRTVCEYCSAAFETSEKVHTRLAERDKERDLLLGMSHDLRAPGNSALYALRDLLSEEVGGLTPEQRLRCRIVEECLEDQLDMISDLLDFARNQSGMLEANREAISLTLNLPKIIQPFKSIAEQKGLDFKVTDIPDVSILCDPQHLKRMIANLLSNAIKYTDFGYVSVEFEATKQTISIKIVDSGTGIAGEERHLLFKEFSRLPSASGKPGFGLGLVIARDLALANSGSLSYVPNPVGGSVFGIQLNRAENSVSLSGDMIPEILLIDDDPSACRTNKRYLSDIARSVHTATSGEAALQILSTSNPDLIVSDVHIGNFNAERILAFLKKRKRRVPTLLLSGTSDQKSLNRFKADLPLRWLSKPAGRDVLQQAVKELYASQNEFPKI